MPSLKYLIETIILGTYEYSIKNDIKIFSVDLLHSLIMNVITAYPKTVANHIKMLKLMGYIELKNDAFYLTDKFMQKGKELHEQKIEPIEKPEKSETDESGFYKY
jgi:predicted nucleic acid-binding Zn ribbon protein